jgi:hypothetical protein
MRTKGGFAPVARSGEGKKRAPTRLEIIVGAGIKTYKFGKCIKDKSGFEPSNFYLLTFIVN